MSLLAPLLSTLLLLAAGIETDLQQALRASGIDRNGLGLVVGRAGGPVLLSVGAAEARIPASNQKLITGAVALRRLGRDFSFRTIFARGPNGTLVVVGDGDPNMSGRFFDGDPNRVLRALAADLKAEGLKAVPGGILLDATRFDDRFVHPDWPVAQLDKWYCAPVAAIVYNDSCWDITVRPGAAVGMAASVLIEPSIFRPALDAACTTVPRGRRHGVRFLHTDGGGLRVQGTVVAGTSGESGHLAVKDPVLFFGNALRAALVAEGVPVGATVKRARVEKPEVLLVYKSTLQRTLEVMLGRSQNLYAECLFKRSSPKGSFESAATTAVETLRELGVPTAGIVVSDGSGMARTNRVSARTLYTILQKARDEPFFVDSLASGGEGTLRKRYRSLGKRIRAKTGYISGVSSLSGYVEGQSRGGVGQRYVFSILCNGRSTARARRLQDLIVTTLARR